MNRVNVNKLQNVPIFSKIEQSYLLNKIIPKAQIKQYHKNENIYSHGDMANMFYIVESGWLRILWHSVDGKEITTEIYSEGDSFNETGIFNEIEHTSSCQSLDDTSLIEIPVSLIKEAIEDNHLLALNILSYMSDKIIKISKRAEHFYAMSSAQRVGCFLLQFCNKKNNSFKLRLPFNKGIIAGYLGMNFETFSRILTKLRDIGIVKIGRAHV